MSISPTMLLPLGSSPRSPTSRTLETRVRQIEAQKGSFRTVTEKSLQQDIQKKKTGATDIESETAEEEDQEDDSRETKQKKLWEAREEMLKQLFRAQNETLTALDSISLLLSGVTKTRLAAKSSMSPALSAAVPEGTFEAQKVRVLEASSSLQQRNESLHLGYKIGGLEKAIEKLTSAQSRLDDEAHRESAFWKQVAALSAEGFVISRLPTDSRTVSVHFGFPEAAPRFRNRGFAVLRTNQEGQLELDQTASTLNRRYISVSVLQDGIVTSRSTVISIAPNTASLAAIVAELRRSLFEEELFFEIVREARSIANQGVRVTSNMVMADVGEHDNIRIELVSQGTHVTQPGVADDGIAEAIALSLRGLLSKGHKQSLARRSQTPAPMTLKVPPVPEYALLRPILSHMRHHHIASTLQKYLQSFQDPMDNAGLTWKIKTSSTLVFKSSSQRNLAETLLLDAFLAPADTKFDLILPTGRIFELSIRTQLAPPTFGTAFTASSLYFGNGMITPSSLASLDSVKSNVCDILRVDILQLVERACTRSDRRWILDEQHYDKLKLGDSTLRMKIRPGKVGLHFLQRKGAKSLPDGSIWTWETDRMSEMIGNMHENKEPRHLLDVIGEITEK